jgi:hypothetical protein
MARHNPARPTYGRGDAIDGYFVICVTAPIV